MKTRFSVTLARTRDLPIANPAHGFLLTPIHSRPHHLRSRYRVYCSTSEAIHAPDTTGRTRGTAFKTNKTGWDVPTLVFSCSPRSTSPSHSPSLISFPPSPSSISFPPSPSPSPSVPFSLLPARLRMASENN